MGVINHTSIPGSLPLSPILTILARILIFWQKTLFHNSPMWHYSCTDCPNLTSGYFDHCAKAGDPAEQQTALSGTDTRAKPRGAAQRTHCPLKSLTGWPQKIPGVCISQKLSEWQGLSKHFVGFVGIGGIWCFSKSTPIRGPLSNPANMWSRLRKSFLSDSLSLGLSGSPQRDSEKNLTS